MQSLFSIVKTFFNRKIILLPLHIISVKFDLKL